MVEYEWQRVARDLAQQIDSGRIRPGAALPGIVRLAKEYGVADHTIRRALRSLREAGRIETLPHKGSFVSEQQ
ncbi:winged helix-turn-helix domain-containing protein [Streptomyces sp. NBC_00208]|uniref:winged helix-turn-helix domain-containing protein n=1 Tax=Streptomyces sp. NBC_00208 TaxID=2975681 RepID=UPI002E29B748|nr:winged helix-turn-helix domain-containing protein [Streptomyces sp. NBC_00208]